MSGKPDQETVWKTRLSDRYTMLSKIRTTVYLVYNMRAANRHALYS